MPKYESLPDDDLSLAIDRTRIAIEGQKQIAARLVASAVGFKNDGGHRRLVDTHLLSRDMLELDLRDMEAERERRN